MIVFIAPQFHIDFLYRFINQENASRKKNHVTATGPEVRNIKQGMSEVYDPRNGKQQKNPHDESKRQSNGSCSLLLLLSRYKTTKNGNENNVVNSQHNFHQHKGEEAYDSTCCKQHVKHPVGLYFFFSAQR